MSAPAPLGLEDHALLERAAFAAASAYAPYSKFLVGAALRTARGAVFTGCNVENASYGLTLCAERNAVGAAVAAEGAGMRIVAIAVVVDADRSFPPCGACRQVILEFAEAGAIVLIGDRGPGPVRRTTIGELLPGAFTL